MMPKHTGEPDLALVGLALLIILAFMMWQDRPIQSPRPYDSTSKHSQPPPRVSDNSYESWLWQDPFEFQPELKKEEAQPPDRCHIPLEEQINITKVIKLEIKVHPDTIEAKELRTRSRYAVAASLTESGYSALKPNKINSCTTNSKHHNARWEIFTREQNDNVLVIWLDADQLPANKELCGLVPVDAICKESNIISNLVPVDEICKKTENIISNLVPFDAICKKSENIISITIQELSKIQLRPLADELKNRKITEPSEILLITEHDTKSIQTIATDFCQAFKDNVKDCNAAKISNYKYFKGLDAYQRQLGKQSQESISKTVEKREEILSIMDQHNLPIGPAQFDYLYRLTRQIKESHKDSDHKKHIKAVGVFGSDFYDKLVIFEALRAEIPNIVLFTTDLDAEMLHPQYWRWTRNLIVATPFDLRLNDKFQKQIPPFRDSLQTQIYYEILKEIQSVIPASHPLIFEIGRNGPVYLYGYQKESAHPDYTEPQERLKNQLILWFFIAIALIFTVQQIKPHSGAIVVWLFATTVCLSVLASYAINLADEEPFSFTGGVSMWPSILLRWLTFSLAVAFIYSAIRSLEANFDRLNRRYYPAFAHYPEKKLITLWKDEKPLSEKELFNKAMDWIAEQSNESSQQILPLIFSVIVISIAVSAYAYYIEISIVNILLLITITLIFLITISFLFHARELIQTGLIFLFHTIGLSIYSALIYKLTVDLTNDKDHFILLILLMILILLILIFGKKIKSIQIMVEKDTVRTQEPKSVEYKEKDKEKRIVIPSEDLWKEYYLHGRFRHRLLRASLKFSIFMIVAALLYQLFPVLPPPCRGDSCIFWEEISRVLSFSIIMLLTFLVLDAQRLCLHWIEKIRTKHPLFVNKTILPEKIEEFIHINDFHQNYKIYIEIKSLYEKLKSGNKIPTDSEKNSLEKLEKQLTELENEAKNSENSSTSNQGRLKKPRNNLEMLKANVLPAYAQKNPADALKSLQDIVTLVAKRTRIVDQLIYYPLITIMLLLIARMSYFDNIAFPLHIGFTVILSISLLLYAGAKLRIEAVQLKRTAINAIRNLQHSGKETVIREIQEIDYGAFEPLFEQPAIRSLLLTLGFLGLIIGEYFKLFG